MWPRHWPYGLVSIQELQLGVLHRGELRVSDNIELIETMKKGGRSFGLSAAVFDDIYHLACDCSHIIFEHAPRETNYAAHDLATLARSKVSVKIHL